ncbi:Alpha-N-acetylgalactosaminidase [Hypsibius exemplaris]|uniref:Alpha-galactosidase n=1 Tax=Hypsibius exemplaris TaxID=2072580 RepID=A0A9X6NCX5_HYPEX|nr:Alpha-N-acetylgalactosaminidase [Hypsibius exemplaris]
MAKVLSILALLLAVGKFSEALDNGLVLTPPMGWLSWERFRCNTDCKNDPENCISERLFMEMAERMAKGGFKEAGYEYIISDDCWLNKSRDADGFLIPDPERFPNGIKFLSDYVHSLGLKFGIYEDIGTFTCGGFPGIAGHEKQDMQTFADWGVDYIKIDGCYKDPNTFPQVYPDVGRYINETGRPMVYSCEWPLYVNSNVTIPWVNISNTCNLWRGYGDVQDDYNSLVDIAEWYAENQDVLIPIAGPGRWNDPDMLIIGDFELSFDQQKTQMALWSVLAAPLLMSNDLRHLEPQFRRILLNRNVIAVSQDKLGIQGRRIVDSLKGNGVEVWVRPITPTAQTVDATVFSFAVLLWSRRDDGVPFAVSNPISAYGLTSKTGYFLRNLYTNQDYGFFRPTDVLTVRVNPSGVIFFKATPVIAG